MLTPLAAEAQRYSCTQDKLRTSNDIVLNHTSGDRDDPKLTEHFTQRSGRCVHVALFGGVRLSEDLRDVAELPSGSRAFFHELTTSGERRLEIVPEGGGVRRTYVVNGRAAAYDDAARRWLNDLLVDLVRRNGYDAERRVATIRARGGTDAVLREISELESDGVRRRYYTALLTGAPPLSDRDTDRVLRRALTEIRSDGDRRTLILAAMRDGRRLPPDVLRLAMDRIGSDGDRRTILMHALRNADRATALTVLQTVAGLRSDGDKSSVLQQAARTALPEGNDAIREAFFTSTRTIRSDGERRRVLTAALRASPTVPVAHGAIASTSEIRSDGEKTAVLLAVARLGLTERNEPLRQAYLRAAGTIRSDSEARRAMRAVSP